jgi:nucleoside-diphosphate-sugar epimerase
VLDTQSVKTSTNVTSQGTDAAKKIVGRKRGMHNDKAKELLGWRPRDIETSLIETAQGLRRHGP